MNKFFLNVGDHLNLEGFSMEERKDIQRWLEDRGNKFHSDVNGFDSGLHRLACGSSAIIQKCKGDNSVFRINRTDELIEAMQTDPELPEQFVITNADNLAVRQWLKDLGYTWCNGGSLTEHKLEAGTLCCYGEYKMTCTSLEFYKRELPSRPVITPNLCITGFDITYPETSPEDIKKEEIKSKIKALQEELSKLEG